MIRSSFDPDHAPEINRQTVRYSMYFHDGEADPATLTRLGAAWNHPLIVFPANLQAERERHPVPLCAWKRRTSCCPRSSWPRTVRAT
jgi:hypothetical protein